MTLSPGQRSEMYRQIRMVMVRHFIDIGRITINISMNSVRLAGSLARLPGVAAKLTPEIVQALFGEIRRIPGVRRLDGYFDNWRQADGSGGWIPIEDVAHRKGPMGQDKSGQSVTIEIKETDGPTM